MLIQEPEKLQELLGYVKEMRGLDFNAYRSTAIKRRLDRRLGVTGMPDYAAYKRFITDNPLEMNALLDSLTIKTSCFFRNPLVFEVLMHNVLPELFHANKELRIWCAGSAKGEEAYSAAILVRDFLSANTAYHDRSVFIIATDIDRNALEYAKSATYEDSALAEVKKGYMDKYFIEGKGRYSLAHEIRSMVTFAYHDITSCNPPVEGVFSDYHMIFCRNLLIYFERELQLRVLTALSGFLAGSGCLVLGEAESLPSGVTGPFKEAVPNTKIFIKGG